MDSVLWYRGSASLVSPPIYANPAYDPLKDFSYVTRWPACPMSRSRRRVGSTEGKP